MSTLECEMRYGSFCSGVEAASLAWEPLGMSAAWFAEVDPFCKAVLAHHWPGVPNLGDVTANDFCERATSYGPIDVLVGGPPCQDFSSAGKRAGLSGSRGNLTMRFLEAAEKIRPRWIVWENVPGVLSQDGGRAFGAILGRVAELGYGWAYRVLDAQFLGVPQRRRRVFVVGCLGDARLAESVLFEQEGEGRDLAPGCEEGAVPARDVKAGTGTMTGFIVNAAHSCAKQSHARQSDISRCLDQTGGFATNQGGTLVVHATGPDVSCIPIDLRQTSRGERMTNNRTNGGPTGTGIGADGGPAYTVSERGQAVAYPGPLVLDVYNQTASEVVGSLWSGQDGHSGSPFAVAYQCHGNNVGPMGTLRAGDGGLTSGVPFVAYGIGPDAIDRSGEGKSGTAADRAGLNICENRQPTLRARSNNSVAIPTQLVVRRLTPAECELLQGFPKNHTLVPRKPGPIRKQVVAEVLAHLRVLLGREVDVEEAKQLVSDAPRYRAIGNSMAVPVMRWIGKRLREAHGDQKSIPGGEKTIIPDRELLPAPIPTPAASAKRRKRKVASSQMMIPGLFD